MERQYPDGFMSVCMRLTIHSVESGSLGKLCSFFELSNYGSGVFESDRLWSFLLEAVW